jgi:hypothetical protein
LRTAPDRWRHETHGESFRYPLIDEVHAMASTFAIHARQDWTFQLVLLGGRTQLEGWCDAAGANEAALQCSTWLDPQDDPHAVAHGLIVQPRCALPAAAT